MTSGTTAEPMWTEAPMPRWEPHARERLVTATLQLFSEQTYDKTTIGEIADRAGLNRSTFFRYFPDKREVLAAGQDILSRLFTEGIAAAPNSAEARHGARGPRWQANLPQPGGLTPLA